MNGDKLTSIGSGFQTTRETENNTSQCNGVHLKQVLLLSGNQTYIYTEFQVIQTFDLLTNNAN